MELEVINNIEEKEQEKEESLKTLEKSLGKTILKKTNTSENHKIKEIKHYKDSFLAYIETFKYNDINNPEPDEKCISKITIGGNEVGYRYYKVNSDNYMLSQDNYFSIVENEKGFLAPSSKSVNTNTSDLQYDILYDIYRQKYIGKQPYEILGDHRKSLAFLAIANSISNKNYIIVVSPGLELKNKLEKCYFLDNNLYETYFSNQTEEIEARLNKDLNTDAKNTGTTYILQVALDEHVSLSSYFPGTEKPFVNADSSGAHYKNNLFFFNKKVPRPDLFGNDYIGKLILVLFIICKLMAHVKHGLMKL